jgi:hypothetical protein
VLWQSEARSSFLRIWLWVSSHGRTCCLLMLMGLLVSLIEHSMSYTMKNMYHLRELMVGAAHMGETWPDPGALFTYAAYTAFFTLSGGSLAGWEGVSWF